MMSRRLISAVAGLMALAGPARAVDFEAGIAAFYAEDYATARAALAPLAEKGDGVAQYYIGVMYLEGRGVKADAKAAFQWLSHAAVFGVPEAQHRMGEFYVDDGLGVRKNLGLAAGWFEEAAAQNFPPAQYRLGLLYRDGAGKPQSYWHAERYFRLAAEQGLADAQFELANLYFKGLGVPQDYARAAEWSRRAAEQGHTKAQVNLGYLYAEGKGVDKDLVAAHKWLNLAAAAGDEEGLVGRETIALQMSGRQVAEAQKVAGDWRPEPELDLPDVPRPVVPPLP